MFSTTSGCRGSCYMYNVSMAKCFCDERTYGIKVSIAPGSVVRLGKGEAQTCSMSAYVFVAGNLHLCQHTSSWQGTCISVSIRLHGREPASLSASFTVGLLLMHPKQRMVYYQYLVWPPLAFNTASTLLGILSIKF